MGLMGLMRLMGPISLMGLISPKRPINQNKITNNFIYETVFS